MQIINNTVSSHWSMVKELLSEADEVLIASPFCYSDFTEFADVVTSCGVRRVQFVTTLKEDEVVGKIDSLLSFCREMKRIGVVCELCIDNRLHGKVYLFKKDGNAIAAIVSSANLTRNGMELNHEWGVKIDDVETGNVVEKGVMADVEYRLTEEQICRIEERARELHPEGVKKVKPQVVDIGDIVTNWSISKDTRIFIKPIGVSGNEVYYGDFSTEKYMYFSKKRPSSVRIGDILIAYGVGSCKIIGAYRVESAPIFDEDNDPRWPWYVEAVCLTPSLSNHKWEHANLHVTRLANKYAENRHKPVTHNGGINLNGLNFGCDKIRLSEDYGRYLLGVVGKYL